VLYHADGELCRKYAPDEMMTVAQAAYMHKAKHITYHNIIKDWVLRETHIDMLTSIVYGIMDLPLDLLIKLGELTDENGV
jgi:hypothetical protein